MILGLALLGGIGGLLWGITRPSKLCRMCGHSEGQHLDGQCFQAISPEFAGEFERCGCAGFWRP